VTTTTKYFDRWVKVLDASDIRRIVRETNDTIAVFGEGDDRFDAPKDKIRFASRNVLIDLPFYEIVRENKVSRSKPLPTDTTEARQSDY